MVIPYSKAIAGTWKQTLGSSIGSCPHTKQGTTYDMPRPVGAATITSHPPMTLLICLIEVLEGDHGPKLHLTISARNPPTRSEAVENMSKRLTVFEHPFQRKITFLR